MPDAAGSQPLATDHPDAIHRDPEIHEHNLPAKLGLHNGYKSPNSASGSEGANSSKALHNSLTFSHPMAPSSCTSNGSGNHVKALLHPGSNISSNHIKITSRPVVQEVPLVLVDNSTSFSTLPAQELILQDRIKRLDGVMSKIDNFVQVQDEVTGFRIATQQKQKAIELARENVSKCDKAFIDALRKARIALPDDLVVLLDELEEARNKLGPLEYDVDRLEFQQVSKEYELKEEGKKIRRQYHNLSLALPAEPDESDEQGEASSYASSEKSTTSIRNQNPGFEGATLNENLGPWTVANDEESRPISGTVGPTAWTPNTDDSLFGTTAPSEIRRGIGNIQTNLDLFAPDLSQQLPWTLHYTSKEGKHLRSYVTNQDHGDNEGPDTDNLEQGALLLQDKDTDTLEQDILPLHDKDIKHRFLSYSTATISGGIGGLVNGWLRIALQVSQLEVLLLSGFVADRHKGYGMDWLHEALAVWDKDEAATSQILLAPRTTSSNGSEVRRYSGNNSTVVSRYSRIFPPSLEPETRLRMTWSGKHEIYRRKAFSNAPLVIELSTASRICSVP